MTGRHHKPDASSGVAGTRNAGGGSAGDVDGLAAAAAASLGELKEEFRSALLADIAAIGTLFDEADGDLARVPGAVAKARGIAHDIKGYAPSVGFEAAGRVAASLERLLRKAESGVAVPAPALAEHVRMLSLTAKEGPPKENPEETS